MARIAIKLAASLIVAAAFLYLGDWAAWKWKNTHGAGMDTVSVSRFVVAPLKGGKEEYYFDGTGDVPCSRSIFPQAGSGACWWLNRHRVVFDRSSEN